MPWSAPVGLQYETYSGNVVRGREDGSIFVQAVPVGRTRQSRINGPVDSLLTLAQLAVVAPACLLVANPQLTPELLARGDYLLTIPACLAPNNISDLVDAAAELPWANEGDNATSIETTTFAMLQTKFMPVRVSGPC